MTPEEAKEYIQMNKSVLQQRLLQCANEDLDTDRVQDYNLALGRLFEAFDMATEALTKVERYEKAFGKIRAEIADTLDVGSLVFIELHEYKIGVISTDDVIEKFNRVTKVEVLKIIEKYWAESEDK